MLEKSAGDSDFKVAADCGNLTVALALAKAGLPIFPAEVTFNRTKGKWDKKPLIKNWQQDATTGAHQLREWWRIWPEAVPGIELGRAGLVVVDCDRHGGADGIANLAALVSKHIALAAHPVAQTPGDGQHHYFRQWRGESFGNSPGELRGKGVDIRGCGGWTVAPGSLRPDGKRWAPAGLTKAYIDGTIPILPDWIAAMIRLPKRASKEPTRQAFNRRPAEPAAEEAKVRSALQSIPSDDRETWLRVGAALHWSGWNSARDIWDEWSRTTPGAYDLDDQDKTWRSFDRPYNGTPVTLATVFHLARENGWAGPNAATLASGLRAGEEQPHRDLQERNTAKQVSGDKPIAANASAGDVDVLKSARASTFEVRAIQWLWPGRFALGKLGIVAGLPDKGKGQILADMAARVTHGLEWPCGEGRAPGGNVVLLTAEDDPNDTVVPRLLAAGADLDRIEIISMVGTGKKDRMFSLMTDLDLLRQKITEVGDVRMVQIDPISAYLGVGKVDSFRTTDVRAVLAPVVELAAEHKVAIIGLMHFNKKTDVTNAMLRVSDSLAFVATARHCYVVVDDEDNKRKLFLRAKNNLAPDHKALAYGFGVLTIGQDRQTGDVIEAPHIVWHPQHVDITATEAMEAAATGQTSHAEARDTAKKFLAKILASGPVLKHEIEEAAEANCVSERTLWRAKNDLGVIAKKSGLVAGWTWELPQSQTWHNKGDSE